MCRSYVNLVAVFSCLMHRLALPAATSQLLPLIAIATQSIGMDNGKAKRSGGKVPAGNALKSKGDVMEDQKGGKQGTQKIEKVEKKMLQLPCKIVVLDEAIKKEDGKIYAQVIFAFLPFSLQGH